MSGFLRCFGKTAEKSKCKCKCNCKDETDGKGFSKNLVITEKPEKCKKNKRSCCDIGDRDGSSNTDGSSTSSPTSPMSTSHATFTVNYEANLPEGRSYMPVSKNDPLYKMNHPRRGKALIFNFDRWDNTTIPHLGLSPRLGSSKDKKDLARCLRKLDFEVEEHDNVPSKGDNSIWKIIERVQEEDHWDADCLVVAVMTHGEKNTVYFSDGTQSPVNLIWEMFEANLCPSLAGKPKIFIIQACRGRQYDSGTTIQAQVKSPDSKDQPGRDVTDSSTFSYVIPNAADIIVAFSCPLGHYSWRHPERGSWFIQAICKVFTQHAYDMDLQSLFTYVAREVALNYRSDTTNYESNNKYQVTSTSSTLIRTVLFKPKIVDMVHHHISAEEIAQEIGGTEVGNGVSLEALNLLNAATQELELFETEITNTATLNLIPQQPSLIEPCL